MANVLIAGCGDVGTALGLRLRSPFASVVLRSAGIDGPGRKRLVENVRSGKGPLAKGPPRYVNLIHREDRVGVLHDLMELDQPKPLYLGVDHEPVDRNTLIRWLAQRMGVPVSGTGKEASSGRRKRSDQRCRNDRLVESGYRFRFPTFREGCTSVSSNRGRQALWSVVMAPLRELDGTGTAPTTRRG